MNFPVPLRLTSIIAGLLCLTPGAGFCGEKSIDVSALVVSDVLYTAHGGQKQDVNYINDIRLQAALDLDALAGMTGGKALISGRSFTSSDFSARHLGEFQKTSNIDTSRATRLYEAWYDQSFFEERLSLRTGLYDLNSEFDVTPPALLFLNASQGIGTDFGQSGRNGPSIFPVTSLAARIAWSDPSGLVVMAAVLDGTPGDPAHPKRTIVRLDRQGGALLTTEILYRWDGGQIGFGAWGYTAPFERFPTVADPAPLEKKGNQGFYGVVSGVVAGQLDGPRLEAYIRASAARETFNPVNLYLGGGLVGTGFFASRPDDQMGVAVGYAHTGAPFRLAEGAGRAETVLELTYRAQIAPWLTLQPDAQLFLHPGFDQTQSSGAVIGLRFELNPSGMF